MLYKLTLLTLILPLLANAACQSENDTSIPAGARVIRQNVNLQKVFQRVVRRDCSGQVISDKEESIGRPVSQIRIEPVSEFRMFTVGDTTYNRTTCEDQGMTNALSVALSTVALGPLASFARAEAVFNVNADSDVFMHVKPGQENYIDFSFTRCLDANGSPDRPPGFCKNVQTVEKGVLVLNVTYEEIHANGLKEISKTPEECRTLGKTLRALFTHN